MVDLENWILDFLVKEKARNDREEEEEGEKNSLPKMMQHCWITPADQLQITEIIHRHSIINDVILCQCLLLLQI